MIESAIIKIKYSEFLSLIESKDKEISDLKDLINKVKKRVSEECRIDWNGEEWVPKSNDLTKSIVTINTVLFELLKDEECRHN